MSLSIWQILLVAVLFILLLGRGRIPALMGDLAEGIRSFKKGMSDEQTALANTEATTIPTTPLAEATAVVPTETENGAPINPLPTRQS